MTECTTTDPMITVTIGDGEDALTLTPDCPDGDEGLWWSTLVLPQWQYRTTTAPPDPWVPGTLLLAVVEDSAALNLTVGAIGADTEALEAQKAVLEAALAAWPYTVTITVDDGGAGDPVVLGPWEGLPTIPFWGEMSPQQSGMFAAEAGVVAVLNPVGSP